MKMVHLETKPDFLEEQCPWVQEQLVPVAVRFCLEIEAIRVIVHGGGYWLQFHVLLGLYWLKLFSVGLPCFIYISLFHQLYASNRLPGFPPHSPPPLFIGPLNLGKWRHMANSSGNDKWSATVEEDQEVMWICSNMERMYIYIFPHCLSILVFLFFLWHVRESTIVSYSEDRSCSM